MEDLTRRKFIQGTTALVAAAGVGIPISEGLREHGPVDLKFLFFSNEPMIIRGSVFSDEKKDVFGINAFFYNTHQKTGTATMSLTRIREIVKSRSSGIVRLSMKNEDGDNEPKDVLIGSDGQDLTFREGEHEEAPFWLSTQDVQQVL